MENRLREFRKAKRLSLEKLGAMVGTSGQQISRLEKGQRKLTKEWAVQLAPHLGTTWETLMAAPQIGFADASAAFSPPSPSRKLADMDDEFGEISEAVHNLLAQAGMPTDPRTVGRLARRIERDIESLGSKLPFHERLALVLSETISRLQRKWDEVLRG